MRNKQIFVGVKQAHINLIRAIRELRSSKSAHTGTVIAKHYSNLK